MSGVNNKGLSDGDTGNGREGMDARPWEGHILGLSE